MGIIFLVLFGVTLFVMYLAVRRSWGRTLYVGSYGAIACAIWVILYALSYEKTSTAQAFFAGVVIGVLFAGATVIIAAFFRANEPSVQVRLASQPQPTDDLPAESGVDESEPAAE
ncbi:MAG: hypothetical protein JW966_09505 [Anaerolineae bacterium]|nr:hypothetical protein [Anaerolineae bacterium]